MTKKRKIRFKKFADVRQEAQSLLESGYQKNGRWSLGQVCDHLARSLKAQSGMASRLPSFMQLGLFTVAGAFVQATGGRQVPTAVPPRKDITDEQGVKRLTKAIKQFKTAAKNSGTLGFRNDFPRQVKQFHLRHCAHHFGFLAPSEQPQVGSNTTEPAGKMIEHLFVD